MDPNSGDQPLFNEDRTIVVTVNGELYNYQALLKHIKDKHPNKKFATNSDCEVGLHRDDRNELWCEHTGHGCVFTLAASTLYPST